MLCTCAADKRKTEPHVFLTPKAYDWANGTAREIFSFGWQMTYTFSSVSGALKTKELMGDLVGDLLSFWTTWCV